ncbi:heme peroxidase [Xylariaceae sp. FL1019]|nr:heme peroxidase [Xylariaceae sp. FL1019]
MRYACFFPALLSLSTLAGADPTWPSPIDEIEEIMYQVSGYRARQFGGTVIPCSNTASGLGRQNAAEWVRTAFHDMATTYISDGPRKGGLDGSLQYELLSSDNIGPGFNTTLQFMADYYTSRSGVADLIALGLYYAIRSCGGPVVPIAAGRVDAKAAGPIGVPLPQNSAYTFTQQFLRMGFTTEEMIQVTACGHSLGGVHETEFPEIVPVGSTDDGEGAMDSTVAVFDNNIVTEYIAGNTTNPLVVGPSIKATRNSDFKVFNIDKNVTVKAMAPAETFNNVCATVLRKMIEVVPDGVVLTDPVQPYEVKPVDMQLTLNNGASTMQLSGLIRIRSTDFDGDTASTVTFTYKNRNGGDECGSGGCNFEADLLGATQGFDDTFVWFPIQFNIPTATGISSFVLSLNMASGTSKTYDNNGESYPMQDGILLQQPQSCMIGGKMTVTAAVRNDLKSEPVNLYISKKTPTGNPNMPIPVLSDDTVEMEQGDCVGAYTFYTASYDGLGDLDYATKFDVISGNGTEALSDDFNAASDLGGTCEDFTPPVGSACSTGASSSTTSAALSASTSSTSTSTSITSDSSPTTSSSMSTTSASTSTTPPAGTTTSSVPTAAATPSHRESLGNYTLVGCQTESSPRALTGASFVYDGMTLESCMKNCTGFYYWGTEYGRECYCGNSISAASKNVTLDDCTMTCSGDDTEYCGAGNRIEVYVTTETIPTPTGTLAIKPTVGAYEYAGCYEELSTRALKGATHADDEMTLELCAESCDGWNYWGTEYGRECYCGNSVDAQSNKTEEADCGMVCAGDATEYCGGSNRIEMYKLPVIATPTTTSTAAITPTNAPTVSSYAFQGCWTEGDGVRALASSSKASDDMTLEACAEFCSDFHFFGTEYGRECYCGDVPSSSSNQTELGDCSVPCSGDATEYCGASNRLNIYYSNTTSGPSQPLIVGNYSWYGCQTEGTGNIRALSSAIYVNKTLTLESCAEFCEGYAYFGTEYADECYCGDTFGKGSSEAASADCRMTCAGNNKEFCGGNDRLSVYQLTELPVEQ